MSARPTRNRNIPSRFNDFVCLGDGATSSSNAEESDGVGDNHDRSSFNKQWSSGSMLMSGQLSPESTEIRHQPCAATQHATSESTQTDSTETPTSTTSVGMVLRSDCGDRMASWEDISTEMHEVREQHQTNGAQYQYSAASASHTGPPEAYSYLVAAQQSQESLCHPIVQRHPTSQQRYPLAPIRVPVPPPRLAMPPPRVPIMRPMANMELHRTPIAPLQQPVAPIRHAVTPRTIPPQHYSQAPHLISQATHLYSQATHINSQAPPAQLSAQQRYAGAISDCTASTATQPRTEAQTTYLDLTIASTQRPNAGRSGSPTHEQTGSRDHLPTVDDRQNGQMEAIPQVLPDCWQLLRNVDTSNIYNYGVAHALLNLPTRNEFWSEVRSINQKMETIRLNLETVSQLMEALSMRMRQMPPTAEIVEDFDVPGYPLPIDEWATLQRLNDAIERDNELRRKVVVFMRQQGGKDEGEVVFRVLSAMINKQLASNITWTGKSTKANTTRHKFGELRAIYLALCQAVRADKLMEKVSNAAVKAKIMSWLRHQPRIGGQREEDELDDV